jgi:AAA15 family ATPase/GTPase
MENKLIIMDAQWSKVWNILTSNGGGCWTIKDNMYCYETKGNNRNIKRRFPRQQMVRSFVNNQQLLSEFFLLKNKVVLHQSVFLLLYPLLLVKILTLSFKFLILLQ